MKTWWKRHLSHFSQREQDGTHGQFNMGQGQKLSNSHNHCHVGIGIHQLFFLFSVMEDFARQNRVSNARHSLNQYECVIFFLLLFQDECRWGASWNLQRQASPYVTQESYFTHFSGVERFDTRSFLMQDVYTHTDGPRTKKKKNNAPRPL